MGFCADSDKPYKVAAHRRERRCVKINLARGVDLPHPKAFGNPWASCKDGKGYHPERDPKVLRK